MRMYDIIAKKRDGRTLTSQEIRFFVRGCVSGEIPDYQLSALLMAICLRGMTDEETAELTIEMAKSGETADLSGIPGVKADKHSTGGVGDKTTLIVAPIVASLGVRVAKMSGRGLGFTGGTIDKMESIPGMRTEIPREEFYDIVRRVGCSVVGQSGNLVPADKKLYALRDVTATVESIPLIASSVMSKKIAAGSDCILLDVKIGTGAFMKTADEAVRLAQTMVRIGETAGRRTNALITDMSCPLGRAVGNSLEIAEVCETLRGRGPEDLTELSIRLAAEMLHMAGGESAEQCLNRVRGAVESGAAFRKLCEMVSAQGGDTAVLEDPGKFPKAGASLIIPAPETGYVTSVDALLCGETSVLLGAGREKKEDAVDHAAGIILRCKPGDFVKKGAPAAELFAESPERCRAAAQRFQGAVCVGPEPPQKRPLIRARVTKDGIERF